MGPKGGRHDRIIQAVRHTCPGNIGIVKILRYKIQRPTGPCVLAHLSIMVKLALLDIVQ